MRRIRLLCALVVTCIGCGPPCFAEKWPGIDEAVVNKIAKEHGREARTSLIDTGEGDLQLLVFLLAGTVGGFAAGYCWRMLLEGKKSRADEKADS